jgi:hypothetical protein
MPDPSPAKTADVLVVAPPSGDIPFVIPVGLIDLVRRLGRRAIGRYPDELDADTLRAARVILLPVHWFYSLAPAIDLSFRLKRDAPHAVQIAGGYTAMAYADLLAERSAIDYVVRGDSEISVPALVAAVLDGGNPKAIAGVTWRGGATPLGPPVDAATLAESDSGDVSWFPTFERAALASQRLADPTYLFPWVVASRGCVFDCPGCYAGRANQVALCGRAMVRRPPEAVRRDLRRWSDRTDIRWVYFNSDFVETIGIDWARAALEGRFALTAYYEWYRAPDAGALDLFLSRFAGAVFGFFYRPDAECAASPAGDDSCSPGRIAEAVRACRGRARVLLYVTPALTAAYPGYRRDALALVRAGHAELKRFDEADLPSVAGRTDERRRDDFDELVARSRRAAPRLARQHRVLTASILYGLPPFGILWRLSTITTRLALLRARLRRLLRRS